MNSIHQAARRQSLRHFADPVAAAVPDASNRSSSSCKSLSQCCCRRLFVGNNFNNRITENIKIIKKLPKIKGVKEILYPGQSKFQRFKNNLKKEIKITKTIFDDLKKLVNEKI